MQDLRHTHTPWRRNGFSLGELLIVIGIIGLVLLFAVPNFRRNQMQRTIEGASQDLASVLALAHSAANGIGLTVSITAAVGATPASVTVTPTGGSVLRTAVMPAGVTLTVTYVGSSVSTYVYGVNGVVTAVNGSAPTASGQIQFHFAGPDSTYATYDVYVIVATGSVKS